MMKIRLSFFFFVQIDLWCRVLKMLPLKETCCWTLTKKKRSQRLQERKEKGELSFPASYLLWALFILIVHVRDASQSKHFHPDCRKKYLFISFSSFSFFFVHSSSLALEHKQLQEKKERSRDDVMIILVFLVSFLSEKKLTTMIKKKLQQQQQQQKSGPKANSPKMHLSGWSSSSSSPLLKPLPKEMEINVGGGGQLIGDAVGWSRRVGVVDEAEGRRMDRRMRWC